MHATPSDYFTPKNSAVSGFVGSCHPLTKDSAYVGAEHKKMWLTMYVLKERATPRKKDNTYIAT